MPPDLNTKGQEGRPKIDATNVLLAILQEFRPQNIKE
jgi:hypothetical protein